MEGGLTTHLPGRVFAKNKCGKSECGAEFSGL